MNFLKKYQKNITAYAKAFPICTLFFLACSVITDENGAWLVSCILMLATFVVCILAQLAHNLYGYKNS